jgi:hypothetical protein
VECERLQAEVDKERALNDHLVGQVKRAEAVHIGAGIHYAEGVQAERDRIIGIIEADYPDADVITDEGKYRITDLIESIRGAQG